MRVASLLFLTLFISACGGGSSHYYVSGESDSGSVNVSIKNEGLLSAMEDGMFGTFATGGNCDLSKAEYLGKAKSVVDDINANLDILSAFSPPVYSVVAKRAPPREDGEIAVYLCDEIGFRAFTLYRSVFISNRFMEEMEEAALEWGDISILDSAIAYVIYHEVGHAAMNHSAVKMPFGTDDGGYHFDMPQEVDADRFAYEMMTLTGKNMLGMVMVQSLDGL